MDHPEHDQPQGAAEEDIGGIDSATGFETGGEQNQAGAEQHREESALGALEEHRRRDPGTEVGAAGAAVNSRIGVGHRQSEARDVHEQDAEQRDSADDVQMAKAVLTLYRAGDDGS